MAITKTKFIEYTRCPRYVALENIKKKDLTSITTYQDYQKEEELDHLRELQGEMLEISDGANLNCAQLESMNPYYKKVELLAGKTVSKMFPGRTIYAKDTQDQKFFEYFKDGLRFLCYVDIYNETKESINIVEIKATTNRKYCALEAGYPKKENYSIFTCKNNIYYLKGELADYSLDKEMPLQGYLKERAKLLDRFGLGSYLYDLAVQRFMIEGCLKNTKPIHYYLGVLNASYTYDGVSNYAVDDHGNELITLFQMDDITQELQAKVLEDEKRLRTDLQNQDQTEIPLGAYCGYKKTNRCPYFQTVCGKKIPKVNSSLCYLNNGCGFKKEDGTRIKGLELINEGYLNLLDIPESWITNENHRIERNCVKTHEPYLNKRKIKAALDHLEYPIYHLDFETFPCPLPRFKGEWPYIQSPFEFSLHIESSPGICDKKKDNIIFLASSTHDEREKLIRCLLDHVDVHKGTLLAQNVSFEKGRIKELASMFPLYHEPLMNLYHRGYDLLWIINNNKETYQHLGFTGIDLDTVNFYDERLSGSYSIKKTLPVFSQLSYHDLVIQNGTEAIIVYAHYHQMSQEEFRKNYEALKVYCQQDTWAMVEILNALRKLIVK